MSIDSDQLEIKHNPDEHRFEVMLDGKIAMVQYMIAGKNIIFTHTEVPPEFEGLGIGNKMAHVALEYAQAEGYKVQAICPFIAAYIRRHPEYQSITWGY
ncbi:MAG: N-acetyltransferase [Anaerolineae bacterium]|nr:N-acetyltransferase [Anaerolineae bacterium]